MTTKVILALGLCWAALVSGCELTGGWTVPPSEGAPIEERVVPAPGNPKAQEDDFTLHWMTTTDEKEIKNGFDWSARFDFDGIPVRRDCVVLYEHWFAAEVRNQGFGLTRKPEYAESLRKQLETTLAKYVPDRNFSGWICLDVEFVVFWWGDRTNGPGLSREINHGRKLYDEWYATIRREEPSLLAGKSPAEQESVLARTYEGAVRLWYQKLFAAARVLRPNAKFTTYGIPQGSRYDADYVGEKGKPRREDNDQMQWVIDLADGVMLPLYQDKLVVKGLERQQTPREITEAQGREYISSNIAEAKRLAKGKPVFALAMLTYPDTVKDALPGKEGTPLNDENLEAMFVAPKEFGADGLIVWYHFSKAREFQLMQREWTERVAPLLRRKGVVSDEGSR